MSRRATVAPGAPAATPPDQPARDRIRDALDVNLLVEAGAGSGKTHSLIHRLMAHVARGDEVGSLAAVTFTRKAAAELRERFQLALESAVRETAARVAAGEAEAEVVAARYAQALSDLDTAFLGTIHSFCGRLLRERPIAAGVDPTFEEVTEGRWEELCADFWRRWLERELTDGTEELRSLLELGVRPVGLYDAFVTLVRYPDVDFASDDVPAPDVAPVRARLERHLDGLRKLMPREEPADSWDPLQMTCRRLGFVRETPAWGRTTAFLENLEEISTSQLKAVQKRWSDDSKERKQVKALADDFAVFFEGDVERLLVAWREHRYPAVLRFLKKAAAEFARERIATGRLGFEDLLVRARDLLYSHASARRDLGLRYRHVLVDEFQDTDPIQAEVCFLLASDPASGTDWRTVALRPGALFVVGDPKQSIYRFRRASFETYRMVKDRFARDGEVLQLTAGFRCAAPVAAFTNAHFAGPFPAQDDHRAAVFAPMIPWGEAAAAAGAVRHYTLESPAVASQDVILADEGRRLATWIAGRIADGARPEQFLILTQQRAWTAAVVRELGERNVPVSLSGGRFAEEHELAELLVVLRALADPDNPVAVAAALEGVCFGLSPADLLEGLDAGLRLTIARPPVTSGMLAGQALGRLHGWWSRAQQWPVDDVVECILDETGLLVQAASCEVGDARAGALVRLVAALRQESASAAGVGGVVRGLETALARSEGSAQLRPERADAVRVMNLHKAKGLEADIVVLAAPLADKEHEPDVFIARGDDEVRSGLRVRGVVRGKTVVVAQPVGWADMAAEETAFEAAQDERLRYVAATRARRELVVGRLVRVTAKGERKESPSLWYPLARELEVSGASLELEVSPPEGRERLTDDYGTIGEAVRRLDERRRAAAQTTRGMISVTASTKGQREEWRRDEAQWATRIEPTPSVGRGRAWGSAVHRVLEGRGRGRKGESLAAFARAVALDEGLAAAGGGRSGETATLDAVAAELVAVAERVWAFAAGQGLDAAGTCRFEFTVAITEADAAGAHRVTEGVIDLAAFDGCAWQVLDWKTDADDAAWAERVVGYQAQVDRYAEIISRLRGEPATGALLRTVTARMPGS